MEREPLIQLDRVTKQFKDASGRDFVAIQDITLTVHSGEFFILVGPSGSGKSTVMRIMAGLDTQTLGTVKRHADVAPGKVGYVFQNFALMPWMTIEDNVGFGLMANRVPDAERNERVREQLRRFKLDQFAKARPKDLSGDSASVLHERS
jgi:NitT/TauT family transport system ATP-binding protein